MIMCHPVYHCLQIILCLPVYHCLQMIMFYSLCTDASLCTNNVSPCTDDTISFCTDGNIWLSVQIMFHCLCRWWCFTLCVDGVSLCTDWFCFTHCTYMVMFHSCTDNNVPPCTDDIVSLYRGIDVSLCTGDNVSLCADVSICTDDTVWLTVHMVAFNSLYRW